MATTTRASFNATLAAAIRDIIEHGFDSAERLAHWQRRLEQAMRESLIPEATLRRRLADAMRMLYRRTVDRGDLLRSHPGVERFTIERLRPKLREELDRRIMASASLIQLNREEAIRKTLQRFSGWTSSVPAGGTETADRRRVTKDVRRSMAGLPFEERRVLIDQGHKMTAAVSEIVAQDSGALGAFWRSNWRQAGYDYREDHKERDGQFYTMRDNWALKKGLMKKGPAGYIDDITKPAEEPFCRCKFEWVYNLRAVPKEAMTARGLEALDNIRRQRAA